MNPTPVFVKTYKINLFNLIKKIVVSTIMILILLAPQSLRAQGPVIPDANGIIYVKEGATGDGSSWANAYPNLADPLNLAQTNTNIKEIWVANGTYYPGYKAAEVDNFAVQTTDRDKAFVIVSDVKLYGGFNGIETSINERVPAVSGMIGGDCILSGDIGNLNDNSDNCYHVVVSVGDMGIACVDGFTITGGNANGDEHTSIIINSQSISLDWGGGMYIKGIDGYNYSLMLNNLTISENTARVAGGLFIQYSSSTLNNIKISENNASGSDGGGLYNSSSSSSLTNVIISGNTANGNGGGILNYNSKSVFTNVLIKGNYASGSSGGIHNDSSDNNSNVQLNHVTISGNYSSSSGGGMSNGNSHPEIHNSIIYGNKAVNSNDNVSNFNGGGPFYYNSLVGGSNGNWGNFGTDKGGNIDADPSFEDPKLATATATTAGDYHLKPNSVVINKGNASYIPAGITTDLDGNPRINSTAPDMGAYEYQFTNPGYGIFYVKEGGAGDKDGSSWANAYPNLADPLLLAAKQYSGAVMVVPPDTIREIWVAKGTYYPMHSAEGYNIATKNFPENTLNNRENAFVLVKDVKLYGGFPANANDTDNALSSILSRDNALGTRNGNTYPTILSGDIGTKGNNSDNCYHVVISSGTVGNACLDGFNITGGNSNGSMFISVNGQNVNRQYGGGMYNTNTAPKITNVIISGNTANYGSGMFNTTYSSPILTNVRVSGNMANDGGGIYNYDNSSPMLTNVTISGNKANDGGGIFNNNSSPKIQNSIIYGNGTSNVSNVSSTPVYNYSLVEDVTTGFALDGINPLFNSPKLASEAPTTAGDYSLKNSSPAIDAGDNNLYFDARGGISSFTGETDLAGNPRLYDSKIDLGAYESQAIEPPAIITPDTYGIVYVNKTLTTGDGSGSSWNNAVEELADALKVAKEINTSSNPNKIYEIWVAESTYYPLYSASETSTGDDRDNAFVLVKDVKIYGGFSKDANDANNAPSATLSVIDARKKRNWNINKTILSGDIGTSGVNTDNCYHVVISSGTVGNACLDGFNITGGNSNGSMFISVNGQNVNRQYGGGMNNTNTTPKITNVIISGNTANYGSGMFNTTYSSPILTNVRISGNMANDGGGIYNYDNSSPVLTNVTISGNKANDGGGIFNNNSSPKIQNSIIYGNGTGNISNVSSTPIYNYSLVEDVTTGFTLDGKNPLFVDPSNLASAPTTAGNYQLKATSPAIDEGDNDLYLAARGITVFTDETDLGGDPRLYSYKIDLGAYESQSIESPTLEIKPDVNGIVYVNKTLTTGDGSGNSWNNAAKELAEALYQAKTNTTIKEIWVAESTYFPLYNASATSTGDDRDNAFVLVSDVKIYGGFSKDADDANNAPSATLSITDARKKRNWSIYKTILSGDIGTSGVNTDNCYHVVISSSYVGNACLDGFNITGGNANGSMFISVNGQNVNRQYGSGMNNANSSPKLNNVIISGNTANYGSGMSNNTYSSPILTNVRISGNMANSGGGMYNYDNSSPVLTNVTISGNKANDGGGLFNNNSSPKTQNSIIYGNGTINISNVSSTPIYTYSLVEGVTTGFTLDGKDPLFVDPSNSTSAPTTAGDYCLKAGSEAIDKGDNNLYLTARGVTVFTDETDLMGNPRLGGIRIDIGAYESAPIVFSPDINGIVYVNKTLTTGNGNGSSWNNAAKEFAEALYQAKTNTTIKEIWVAESTYLPLYNSADGAKGDGDRDNSFVMVKNVKIYGGFPKEANDIKNAPSISLSREDALATRNWNANPTILSGDIGTDGVNTDNCYHVVISSGDIGNACLDGFNITGGNANGSMYISVNGQIINHQFGGGMNNYNSTPKLNNVTISGNTADYGGGIFNTSSSLILTNVRISGNMASSGGGMYNFDNSSPVLTNVTISGNRANDGSGMYNNNNSFPKIQNSIIYGNGANNISNSGSTPVYNYSLVEGVTTGFTLDGKDPQFINPINSSSAPTTAGDYQLKATSPAINVGDNNLYLAARGGILNFTGETDLAGNPRLSGSQIDIGAYELAQVIFVPDLNGIVYVNKTLTTGNGNGSSWNNAAKELADALKAAKEINSSSNPNKIYEIWVAESTYYPLYNASETSTGVNRDNAFVLVSDVKIYGGFSKDANDANNAPSATLSVTDARKKRNWSTNKTILSGDIGTAGVNTDNCYHVVVSSGNVGNACLDGFTITGGNANGSTYVSINGQDIFRQFGAGAINYNSNPKLNNVIISGNTADYGGGMFNSVNSSPSLTNVRISGNAANNGGGVYNNNNSSPVLTNVTIGGNRANDGGGIYNNNSFPQIQNSIIYGNGTSNIHNTNSAPVYNYSLIEGVTTGFTLDGKDPLFVDPSNPTSAPTTAGDYGLKAGSEAIDKGDNNLYLTARGITVFTDETDLVGNPRLVGSRIDIGAYESPPVVLGPDLNGIVYVNKTLTTGNGNGSSWNNAAKELADALKAAKEINSSSNPNKIYEIWVAESTYYPLYNVSVTSTGDDRDNAFTLVSDVKIYGGFSKNADDANNAPSATLSVTDARKKRNWSVNETILSGDIGTAGVKTDNCYHVLISVGNVGNACLDGFTITGGNANGSMYVSVNGQIINRQFGGGMNNYNSTPKLNNVIISGNTADYGGGMFNTTNSSPVLTNVRISGNMASSGGGMYNFDNSSPVLTNVTISGNRANDGSGMFNNNNSFPKIQNSIIYGNGTNNISNSGSTPVYNYSLVEGVTTGFTLDGKDPQFADPANSSSAPTTTGDYRLRATSPAIDIGDNNLYLAARGGIPNFTGETDLAGNPRLGGSYIDIGAYESTPSVFGPDLNGIVYVNKTLTTGNGNGSSWNNAAKELADALKAAKEINSSSNPNKIYEIWVAESTYYPLYNASETSTGVNRDNAFVLVSDVKIYGGFPKDANDANNAPSATLNVTDARKKRNWSANGTILSGDIGTVGVNTDNCYHVVVSSGNVGNACLDGFTITGGNANGSTYLSVNGQDILRQFGAGAVNYNSNPKLNNVIISGNTADYGGGMFNDINSSPSLTNVRISGNAANNGGGVYNNNSTPVLTNVTIGGNKADFGGGIFNNNSSPKIQNSIIYGNGTNNSYNSNNSTPVYNYSLIEGVTTGFTLDGKDPQFMNPINSSSAPTTNGDYRLKSASSAIDEGDNNLYLAARGSISNFAGETDLMYNPRLFGTKIDLGAYETIFYVVAVSANPTVGGTVTGGGKYSSGEVITVSATPAAGYDFVNWTTGGVKVSESANFPITVTKDSTLIANFVKKTFTITVQAIPPSGGSVSGGGTFSYGDNTTITATANTSYDFVNWTKNGTVFSAGSSFGFAVMENATFIANFAPKSLTIIVQADPPAGGSVTGGGTFSYGGTATVTATANTGYNFDKWTRNGVEVSRDLIYSFSVTEGATLTAHFVLKLLTITVSADPSTGGSATGGGTFSYGATATVTATANTGYDFEKWTRNGLEVSRDRIYSFPVTEIATLTAHFVLKTLTIAVSADPPAGGSVTGGGTYRYGENATITASAGTDYTFVNWTRDGVEVSQNANHSFTVNENASFVAHFVLKTYQVIFNVASGLGSLTATVNGVPIETGAFVVYGSTVEFTATPDDRYYVHEWTLNGATVSGNTTTSYTLSGFTASATVNVKFISSITDILSVEVNGVSATSDDDDGFYVVAPCGSNTSVIYINSVDPGATVIINGVNQNPYTVDLLNYSDNTFTITVRSPYGIEQNFSLTINKMIPFDQIVTMRWNNTLSVINNPENNGGFDFESYRWFRNDQEFCETQWWSAGANGEKLNTDDEYQVEMITTDGKKLLTCKSKISLRSIMFNVYPNPVSTGQTINFEADVDDEILENAMIEVCDLSGVRLELLKVQGRITPVVIRHLTGIYIYAFKGKDGFTKEFRVIVK